MYRLLLISFLLLGSCELGWAQATAPTFQLAGNVLTLPSPLTFKPGTAELTPASEAALQHIKQYLDAKTYISLLRLEGHVGGSKPTAQALSEQRAQAVAKWLVTHGVDCHRLLVVGFGSNKPVAAADAAANTRIEAVNVALRGRVIGGLPADGGGKTAADPCQP